MPEERPPVPIPAVTSSPSRYKWWVVAMLWGVCFFNYADRQAIVAVFPLLQKEFSFTKEELGLIGSSFMWVYAGCAPLAGYIGDRFPRKILILGGFLFWSVITVMTGFCSKLWHFVGVRASEGFGEAFYFPASMSLISDYHSPRTRSRAMSFHQSSVYLGTIGGSSLAGFLAEAYGWQSGFYVFGSAGILLSVLLVFCLKEPVRESAPVPAGEKQPDKMPFWKVVGHLFTTPATLILMAVFVGANFVAMAFLVWMPSFLYEKFKLNLGMAGLAATLFISLASTVGAPLGGWLADILAARHRGGRMMVQGAGLMIGAIFVFYTATTRDPAVLMGAMLAFGFCKGLYDSNIFASFYDFVPPSARATAAGVLNSVGWTGAAFAPWVIGRIVTRAGAENEVQAMSQTLSFGGLIYLGCGLLLGVGIWVAGRSQKQSWA